MPRYWYKPGTLRYTAPERFDEVYWLPSTTGPSKEGDVYSLAMVSFEVCFSVVNPCCYQTRPSRYVQVLTGILPYDDSDRDTIVRRIRSGERPSRPAGPNQNQWLQEPVWNAITSGWSHKPEQRCKLSVVCYVLSTHSITGESVHLELPDAEESESPLRLGSHRNTQDARPGHSKARKDRDLVAERVPGTEAGLQQRGKILSRVASFFQFLRDSGSEIERRVNEMDTVGTPIFPTLP